MASRLCGCATAQCNCVVEAGDGIDVTGAGSPANPYVITAIDRPLTGRLLVQDTPTVTMHLSGEGTTNNPWVLSADTSLELGQLTDVDASDTTAGYVVARAGNGTFHMIPAPTAPPGAITTDASLDGDGSAGTPLAVHNYDRIAWLSGADNLPNIGQLRIGESTNLADSAFWVARQHTGAGYDVQADHKISSIVGTDATPNDNPTDGPQGMGGLQLRVQDNNQNPNDWSDFRIYQDGRISKFNHWAVPLGGGAHVIRTQASYIPYAMWSTTATATSDGGDSHSGTILFPAQYFTDATEISLTGNTRSAGQPSGAYTVMFYNVTTSGASFRVRRVDGGTTSGDLTISIQAIQMHPA